ncbi:hypothetical protein FGIG_11921 [Fasciola gigantica]|uniref:Uncharacterized protein n=1 Tax=Fasciola gigantica TaxID=46835 RepID=A0A504YYH8_FASGI|nr:hypothetical protein FGIG_11921 [Fasciola gigantica]
MMSRLQNDATKSASDVSVMEQSNGDCVYECVGMDMQNGYDVENPVFQPPTPTMTTSHETNREVRLTAP